MSKWCSIFVCIFIFFFASNGLCKTTLEEIEEKLAYYDQQFSQQRLSKAASKPVMSQAASIQVEPEPLIESVPESKPAPEPKFEKTMPAVWPAERSSESVLTAREHQFEIAPEFSYYRYEESSLDVKDTGVLVGMYGAYNYSADPTQSWPINVLHLDVHFNYGQIKYKSPDGTADHIDDYLFEPRFWLGRDIALNQAVNLRPYVGIGYRQLFDSFSQAGDGGYDRLSQYLYVPVGFELKLPVSHWAMGFNAEYDFLIRGWQTSYLSDIHPLIPDIKNDQTKGYGIRGSIKFMRPMNGLNWFMGPYVRYWHIDESDLDSNANDYVYAEGIEPENTSLEAGVRLGVEF